MQGIRSNAMIYSINTAAMYEDIKLAIDGISTKLESFE